MLLSRRTTSSTMSRLAFAIIWITCRSCPPPIRTPPPCVLICATLDAPDNAVSVPAKAVVDHEGRFADSGDGAAAAGFDDRCVRLYSGVSEGDSMKRWCDMAAERMILRSLSGCG
jgi:hypothetical protein